MFTKFLAAAATCGLFASSVNAHMMIREPVPYGQSTLNNSPLENDGSDFPCKLRDGVYDITKMNNMPVGVPQNLAFIGGATHGGGSCQVSVTLDKQPTKDSDWKVIHTIVGGCPSNSSENLSGDPTSDGSAVFQFSMPQGMPNGQYTLAWTWFNKIGNREMYMNCAPITVTGGVDNNDVFDSLPTMFVINIPNEECGTIEGEDFVFPDPGKYAETPFRTALGSSTTGSDCAAVTNKGAGNGTPASPAQPTGSSSSAATPPASSPAPTSQAQASPSAPYAIQTKAPATVSRPAAPPLGTGTVSLVTQTSMVTITVSGPPPPASHTDVPSQLPSPTGSPYGAGGSNSTSIGSPSGSCTGSSISCSSDGAVVCIGSNQWGLCNRGCAVPMALADGTSCSGGTISKRDHAGHFRRHLAHVRKF